MLIGLLGLLAAGPARGQQTGETEPAGALRGDGTAANVRAFGAIGDGVADDTEAIQRAVDAGLGGIFLPRGRYRITRPIVIDLDRTGPNGITGNGTATLVMAGAGPALHFVGTHTGTANPESVAPNVWERQRAPLIDAVEIVGAHPEALGIQLEGTMQATLSRLVIRHTLHAVYLTNRNRNVIIESSHLYENRGIGIYMHRANLHQFNVVGTHISYNGGGGIVVRESEIRNLHVGVCDIESNMDPEGPPTANILIDTREGSVLEGAIVGNTIQHNNQSPNSANIRMVGAENGAPWSVGRFSISDNALSDVAVNIHLQHARGVSITGNSIWQGYAYNLLVENSAHVVVASNTFERNPEFGAEAASNILLFRDSEDGTITGNNIHFPKGEPAGLVLQRCRWFNLTNTLILDAERVGLLLEDVAYTRVSDCSIRAGGAGAQRRVALKVTGGRSNMIMDNLLVGAVEVAPGSAVMEANRIEP